MFEKALWTILGALLGGIIKWFIPGSFWNTKLVQGWKLRRQQKKLNDILAEGRLHLTVGSLQIEQMMAQVFEIPLTSTDIICQFEPQPRTLPPDLQNLEFSYLPIRLNQLKSQGKTVDFNDLYALSSIRVERPQNQGKRRNRPELIFEPTNFKYHLMINESLDTPLLADQTGKPVSIRQSYKLDLLDFQWSDVKKIPFHQWFATGVGVITNDNLLVIAIRSEMQAITELSGADSWYRASLSCAEGMLRPVDSVSLSPVETPSPFATAFRALNDELGLKTGEHYIESQVKLIGMGYDKKRCQPVGIFYLELQEMGFLDVYNCWQTAKDRHENMALMPIAVETKSMVDLLLGKTTYNAKPVRLFSNHQQLGTLLVAFQRLGVKPLIDALK